MEPMTTGAAIIQAIYGACGLFCAHHSYKLTQMKYYMNLQEVPEDDEGRRAVNRHFKVWMVPLILSVVLLIFT